MVKQAERQKAYDTSLYQNLPEEVIISTVQQELSGMFLEAGDLPLEERINPRKFRIINGKVIDPESKREVTSGLKFDTSLARQESTGTLSFYKKLIDNPVNIPIVTLSPPGGDSPYLEGRVNVALKKDESEIEFYGVPSKLSPEDFLRFGIRLTEFSEEQFKIDAPDDLRAVAFPVHIPPGASPWEFLGEIIKLDSNAWQSIAEGDPWKMKELISKDAAPIARKMATMIREAYTEQDFIMAGAYGEMAMRKAGWQLLAIACPGLFNFQLLIQNQNPPFSYSIDSFGNVRISKWEYKFGKCRDCGNYTDVGPCSICINCEGNYN